MTRELVRCVVDHVDRHRARRRVDRPPLEAGHAAVAERSEQVLGEHHVVDAEVDHDRAVVGVVRVERVERVAERSVDPHDVGDAALAGQQPDPVAVVGVPPEREAAGERQVEVDGARLVVDDRVALRQRHVVQHRHARQRDVERAPHPAVVADHDVLHVVEPLGPGVDHRVHLARVGIDLRVGGERAGQRAVEVVAPDGLELVGELDRAPAGLDHRPRRAGEPADVGVGPARAVVPVASGDVGLAAELGHVLRAHVPVAVPLGLAVVQSDAVHHAVADEPVVRRLVGWRDRVRAVAEVPAAQVGGQLADHRQIERRDLVGHRRVVVGEVAVADTFASCRRGCVGSVCVMATAPCGVRSIVA